MFQNHCMGDDLYLLNLLGNAHLAINLCPAQARIALNKG